jgi:hypothetical protein
MAEPTRCPFCGAPDTAKCSDFGTSLMVASHYCRGCNSYFEAIKWGNPASNLDVPAFLDPATTPDREDS